MLAEADYAVPETAITASALLVLVLQPPADAVPFVDAAFVAYLAGGERRLVAPASLACVVAWGDSCRLIQPLSSGQAD